MQIHIVLTKVVTIEFSRVSGMWFDMFENARMLADAWNLRAGMLPKLGADP